MKLHLYHGRTDPAADMPDWGLGGPVILGVVHLQYTYGSLYALFANADARNAARDVTGWNEGPHEYGLEIEQDEDMVVATTNGEKVWYGDWCLRPDEDELP